MKEALKGKDIKSLENATKYFESLGLKVKYTAMGHWQIEEILLKQPLLTYPGEIRRTCWIYAA